MTDIKPLYEVRPGAIWASLQKQPVSFWLLCFYFFIEYVRPQTIYPAIDVLPYGQLSLFGAGVAMFIEGKHGRFGGLATTLLCIFMGVVVVSSFTAYSVDQALSGWDVPGNWTILFLLVVGIVTTEERFLILMLSWLLHNFKMSQFSTLEWAKIGFQFRDWGTTGAPGWFHNSGEFGIEMCVFFPIAAAFAWSLYEHWGRGRRILFIAFPVTAVIGMVASSSRGAVLGGAAVALFALAKSRHKVRGLITVGVLSAAVYLVIPHEQKGRFEASGEDKTSQLRLQYWKDGIKITNDHPVLGVGHNNWLLYYRAYYNAKGQVSHNIFVEAGAQLGYVGLGAFLLCIGGTFLVNARTRKRVQPLGPRGRFVYWMAHGLDGALVGYLVSGFFVTVLFYPYFWVNLAFTAALANVAESVVARASEGVPGAQRAAMPRPPHHRRPPAVRAPYPVPARHWPVAPERS